MPGPQQAQDPIRFPDPGHGHGHTASHPNSPWIFRGFSPGRPLDAGYATTRLKHVVAALTARLGTLHELAKLGLVPIIAEALGYFPATIERHRVDSATAYSQYIATIRQN
jgi:hypothetical protein